MAGQHGIALAVALVAAHFGDLVAKVCECLLRRGTLSLHEAVRFTELSSSQVKNCLLVLIQHNCVQAFSVPKPAGRGAEVRTVTQYMAIFDNIIHRLRFAKFLAIVREDLGLECETLFEGLLQHGRLTFEQLVVRASSKQSEATRDVLRSNFDRLVHSHYVERCPRPEPFITPVEEDEITRKRSAKSGEESLSTEQQAMMAAALLDAERFCEIMDNGTDMNLDVKNTERLLDVSVGEKRKHETLELDQDIQTTITENEILWRANYEKFVHCLKKKACVANVRSRMSLDAGIIFEVMIDSSVEQKVKTKNHVKSSLDGIIEGVNEKLEGRSMTSEQASIILDQLGCRLSNEETGAQYSIDLSKIIENCQNDEVEALVLNRYGQEAYRIFRLFSKNGRPYETDNISDITFVEKKEAQRLLYKLWKDGYLDMEKIISHATGQQQLFLWKVNKKLPEHILNDMYHAALNLCQKIAYITEQEHEVLQVKEKLLKLKRSRMILESSLLKLDDALLLFHDF